MHLLKQISWRVAIVLLMAGLYMWPTGAWFRDGEEAADNLLATATLDATLTSADTDFVPVTIKAGETAERIIAVRNVGSLPFGYELQPDFGIQSNPLCESLAVSFTPVGSATGSLDPGLTDEYVVKTSLPVDAGLELINLSCGFEIQLLATQMEFPGVKRGFWDEEGLTNTVASGDWTPNVCSDIRGYKRDEAGNGLKDWEMVIQPASEAPIETLTIMADDMDGESSDTSLDENKIYVIDVENNPAADEEILLMNGLEVTGKTGLVLSGQDGVLMFTIKEPAETDDGGFFVRIYEVSDDVVKTNGNGYYSKEVCEPGHYRVMEVPQNGWEQVSPATSGYKLTLPVDREYTFVNKQKPVKIVINEVYYYVDPDHGDDGGGPKSDEWVELYNPNDFPVNLKKWALADDEKGETLTNRNVYIPAHGFAVLAKAAETWKHWSMPASAVKIEIGGVIGDLDNAGDKVVLKDSLGNEIDAVGWGDNQDVFNPAVDTVDEGNSIQRKPLGHDTDASLDWEEIEDPNPGTNPHSHIKVITNQVDNNLEVKFEDAVGFDRVKYMLSYDRFDEDNLLVPDGTAVDEAIKPELDDTLELDPIYLGTCTSNGVCTPHLGATNGILSLMYYLEDTVLGTSTIPFSWVDVP